MISATASINPQSAEQLRKALGQFATKVQDRIARTAVRKFNNDVIKAARARTPHATGASVASLTGKVKVFNGTVWGAVGYRGGWVKNTSQLGGRALHKSYDAAGVGWRSHFTEAGYHSWPKGKENRNAGKNLGRAWKRRQYFRGTGTYHRGTMATILAQQALQEKLIPYLHEAIVREMK
jgi:hypothetical protein